MQILVLLNGQKVISLENQKEQFDEGKDIADLGLVLTLDTVAWERKMGTG